MSIGFARLALISAGLAVALGAVGSHIVEGRVGPDLVDTWRTAALYHLFHSIGLFALALAPHGKALHRVASPMMAAGILVFCGSLYFRGATGTNLPPFIPPLGGMLLIGSWFVAAASIVNPQR